MGILVHQAVHGYSEGHREFACSAALTPNDARLVLVMSDASGSGVTSEGIPYLSGYPLQESGLYALARTWPALEMPRPGCVWTHTLFIEFSDLAVLDSPSQLATLFTLPTAETARKFSCDLEFSSSASKNLPLLSSQLMLFQQLATALYEQPHDQVWSRRSSDVLVDDVALRIWDLQWPRLRRSFRFCTLTTRDRSQEGALFDLQLCSELAPRIRFDQNKYGVEASAISVEPWLTQLVDYADQADSSGFRENLRLLGTDLLGGRESMRSICSLLVALAENEPGSVANAMSLVTPPAPLSASRIAKGMVANAVLSRSAKFSETELEYIIRNIDFIKVGELLSHGGKLASYLLELMPDKLIKLLTEELLEVRISMRNAIEMMDANLIVKNLKAGTDWLMPLLAIRPDLTEMPEFWRQTQSMAFDVLEVGVELQNEDQLSAAVLGLHDASSISSATKVFGAYAVLACIQRLIEKECEGGKLSMWVKEACHQPGEVASFLYKERELSPRLISYIMAELPPKTLPNDYSDDPWFVTLSEIKQKTDQLPIEWLVYGFQRALSCNSKSVGPLLLLTFEPLYNAAAFGSLSESNMQKLRQSIPWAGVQGRQNLALQLIIGLAVTCIKAHVAPKYYVILVSTDEIFNIILDVTWRQLGGSRYLRWVEESTKRSDEPLHKSRHKLVKRFIAQRFDWWDFFS